MSSKHQYTVINASLETVWNALHDNAEQYGTILVDQQPHLLIAQTPDICYIYALRSEPSSAQKTQLHFVITPDVTAAADVVNAPNVLDAMHGLSSSVDPQQIELARVHLKSLMKAFDETPAAPAAKKMELPPRPKYGVPLVKLSMVWFVFIVIGGIFSASLLLALNWWNMGFKRKAVSTLGAVAISWTAAVVLTAVLIGRAGNMADATRTLIIYIAVLVSAVFVLLWQVRLQRPLYTDSVAQYGPPTWGWRNGLMTLGAIIVGVMMGLVWPTVLTTTMSTGSAILTPLSPRTTYEGERLLVSYPSHWANTEGFAQLCQDTRVDCLITVAEPTAGGAILAQEIDNTFNFLVTLDAVSGSAWQLLERTFTDIEGIGRTEFTIDGRNAVRLEYKYTVVVQDGFQKVSQRLVGNMILLQDGSDYIQIEIITPPPLAGIANSIIDSIHFVKPLDK